METDTVASFWQGPWWSLSLITTVGFLGQPPHSAGGAVLSVVLMVVGFLLLALEAVEQRLAGLESALAEQSSDTYAEAAAAVAPPQDRASG